MITAAQLEAIGMIIFVTISLVGIGWLLYRGTQWLKHPTWKGAIGLCADALFSYIGILIGNNMLGNTFVGIAIGIYMSWLVTKVMDKQITTIANLLSKFFMPVTWIGKKVFPSHESQREKERKSRKYYQEWTRKYLDKDEDDSLYEYFDGLEDDIEDEDIYMSRNEYVKHQRQRIYS